MLTTISSCNSRKTDKFKASEQFADKRNEISQSDSAVISNKNTSESNVKIEARNNIKEVLNIEYTPTYDKDGNLIPFNYNKDEDGKKTTINIKGSGKVNSTTTTESMNTFVKEEKSYKEEFETVVSINKKLQKEIEILKKIKGKETKVYPDYLKYIIIIGITTLLLSGVMLFVFIYFKKQINKYKSILNTISP